MLSAHNLAYERHFRPVFSPLSLDVAAGGLLRVTGANGSGKTTLLRLLAGVLRPSTGRVDNRAPGTLYIGHQLALKDDLTVVENLRFARAFHFGHGKPEEAVAQVGLRGLAQRPVRNLSAGQRKRCALARLLLAEAALWLLDEPYNNLDDDGAALLDRLLEQHLARGGACVLCTHGAPRPVAGSVAGLTLAGGSAGP